jgi:uncharacterized protein
MADQTAAAIGTPIWVDLQSSDPDAAKRFYGALFGWDAETVPDAGGYAFFRKGGKMVAGVGPIMGDPSQQPSAWSTYIGTTDAAAIAQKVRDAGGTVVMGPDEVMEAGTIGVFQDPTGAYFGVWQPKGHGGAEVFNEPGSLTWNELATTDVDAAKRFYTSVFGWGAETHGSGEQAYTEWQLNGRSMAGMMAMGSNFPPGVPPHWLTYFATANTEDTVNKAKEAGGQVMMGPTTIPQGTFAVLGDPTGAVFAVIQMAR